jgi:hypothetical protein
MGADKKWRTPGAAGFLEGDLAPGDFSMATLATAEFFNWGKPAGLPYLIKGGWSGSFRSGEGRRWQ